MSLNQNQMISLGEQMKAQKFYGQSRNSVFSLSPEQKLLRKQYLATFKPDDIIEETLKKHRNPKSYSQVKTIFGLMIESTIAQANDLGIDVSYLLKYLLDDKIPKGQGLTKDFLHEIMYVICPTTDDDGRRVTLSRMNTAQAASLFDQFRNIMAPLGIQISEPDPKWKEKIKEQ